MPIIDLLIPALLTALIWVLMSRALGRTFIKLASIDILLGPIAWLTAVIWGLLAGSYFAAWAGLIW